jgi:uncharacterized protein (UPF0147 family)
MPAYEQNKTQLGAADRELIDLVTSALVDPNVHTDVRMRLYEQITEIVRNEHPDPHGHAVAAGRRPPVSPGEQPLRLHSDRVRDLLTEVLVDPNIHTDTRLRLHDEISRLLRDAKIPA